MSENDKFGARHTLWHVGNYHYQNFPSTTDCYYVGLVTAILPDGTFRANKIKRVWEGKVEEKFWSDTFVAPLPGQHMFDDEWIEPRIQVVA